MSGKPPYRIEVKESTQSRKSFYFRLVSNHNGKVIMTSEVYSSQKNALKSAEKIAAVMCIQVRVEKDSK